MEPFEVNKKIWSAIYKSGKSNLLVQNETLVRMINQIYGGADATKIKLLDYGFGSGNNLKYFRDFGFDIYGVEVSVDAKIMALKKLGNDFLENRLTVMDKSSRLPYVDETFDVVVAWQVLYYNTLKSLSETFKEIVRLLKPGGSFIGTMCRPNDIAAVYSRPLSDYQRVMDVCDAVGNQMGALVAVLRDEREVRLEFSVFRDIELGYFESKLPNSAISSSHWIIYGKK